MKNRILLFASFLFISITAAAQSSTRIGAHDAISWKPASVPKSGFANVAEGRSIAQEIISIVGLKPNFEVREANIPNAAAVSYGGKRFVLYNPNFINQLERTTGTRWAGISVLAHEIGHHLNGHTLTSSGSQPALELEADEFSGFVLRKMGASLSDAQAAMKTIASIHASKTHPGKNDRLTSIANGWNKANAQGGKDIVKNPSRTGTPPAETARQVPVITKSDPRTSPARQTVISRKDILGTIRFNADPYSQYYVTSRYNVVKVKNNQLNVIGKLASSNSRQYPYMIYDNSTNLFVDVYGNILTSSGKRVGKLGKS